MITNKAILHKIKKEVMLIEPTATVILFGSHARGESNKYSDFDILILVDHPLAYADELRIKSPLYDLEFETGKIISPLVMNRQDWETRHSVTPFFYNVKKDGVLL